MIRITGTFAMAAVLFSAAVAPMLLAASAAETAHAGDGLAIVTPPEASALETLAAREVRRYVYLRTGELLPITTQETAPATGAIVIARKDRAPVAATAAIQAAAKDLGPQQYLLKTAAADGQEQLWIVGGDDVAALYGAYRFAEHLGVRFYLHGDVVPDARIALAAAQLDETGKPLFDTRGIQPFHDFPEGPDWWNRDDYLAYVAQLPKMRVNFLGLHCYPEGGVGPEPAVWIGLAGDLDPQGRVGFSYPSQWASTARQGPWGYAAMNTSDFCGGAAMLFESDTFGPEIMRGMMPSPKTPHESNQLFNAAGDMFHAAFAEARALGVKTCIGTETPLTVPKLVQERLRQQGKDPKDPAVVRQLYEGMFCRIANVCPVDYYWLWTTEEWTWGGNKPGQFEAVAQDIQAALHALKAIGKPFTLATCGWVLGPQNDRAALDKILPKDCPMSCINREVGHAADEPGFANVAGRPKWVIPWMENDPNLTAPQPWVGRMRYDAVDARRLGCTGLLGIHWRTKILAGNVAALAAAAWDQSWVPAGFDHSPKDQRGRTMPVESFYWDFARASFGDAVAEPAGKVLAKIDGVNLSEPTTWLGGPGGVKPESKPWSEIQTQYRFVDELAAMRDRVEGAGNLERFDYWLNTYRYMAALAHAGCLRGQLDQSAAAIKAEKDAAKRKVLAEKALPVRIELARVWEKMISLQVAATDTPSELGTLANLEQHSRKQMQFLSIHDAALSDASGRPLPEEVEPGKKYSGPARIIVPTVRTLAAKGEALTLRVMALDREPIRSVALHWRVLGPGPFAALQAKNLGRSVYTVSLPPMAEDVEYYLSAETASDKKIVWPATAPGLCQTVVVGPGLR